MIEHPQQNDWKSKYYFQLDESMKLVFANIYLQPIGKSEHEYEK